jgi:uncharacterized protein YPO0396
MKPAAPSSGSLFGVMQRDTDQFRMRRLQVFNWGTFSGLHDIPIAERGFLFVGPSGAGKTTLLDAFSALLVPPRWVDFNAAAREASRTGRDRNLVSYVRGAWAEQKDDESGEIATRYLRTGTTWSALALTYTNSQQQSVVLVQLFWLRGNANGSTDVKRHYLIFERPFDLRQIKDFDLDVRKLKKSHPDAFAREDFRPYADRFCRLLSIESEQALRLLHKTQSAKNLGDLNTFLRDFMLDRPETFDAAERLVSEFAELNAAHQAVVTARQQVRTLAPAREAHGQLQDLTAQQNQCKEVKAGVDGYKETCRLALLQERIAGLRVDLAGAQAEAQRRKATLENERSALDDLRQQHRELGGDRIEHLEAEKAGIERTRDERLRKRAQVESGCKKLGWVLPDTPQRFAELTAQAAQEVERWQEQRSHRQQQQFALVNRKAELEKEFLAASEEVKALRRQPSNIPAHMLALRTMITRKLGLADTVLPFVGELVEVDSEAAAWRGAIERVLHGFALSLLVDERYYSPVSGHVNEANLGGRLVYYRVGRVEESGARPIAANSIYHKLQIKAGAFAPWLEADLKNRFDYACVDGMQAFRNSERALTREGQVRHGKTRHEKNDRFRIDDRSQWVLGFDNREKLALFEQQAQRLADEIAGLDREIRSLTAADARQAERALTCRDLANIQWQEIDVVPLVERIGAIERALREAREGSPGLQELAARIVSQAGRVDKADDGLVATRAQIQSLEKETREKEERLRVLLQEPALTTLTPVQIAELPLRFDRLNQKLTLDNIDRMAQRVERALSEELEAMAVRQNKLARDIEERFAEFQRNWPMTSGNMDATLASAPDFLGILHRLESDGLPAHEQRFFDLLRNQSHQNLAALSTYMNQARKTILDRMEMVNESLGQVAFNVGTRLEIAASDRQLPEVHEFRQEIRQALSHAWTDDREQAESRFLILRGLVERLASQEAAQRHWRETVLDVRLHVEFIGREVDAEGREVEVYRSGAGKSGGQRQKLATTCLAAALRYQLGSADQSVPVYAPVVLDEAFDKADNEFTALAMNIFANFGFQMIVATPLKSVMTLEPFIGGACFVHIQDRRHSSILMIEYDADRQRLKLPEHTPLSDHAPGETHIVIT